jgi:hypothetical protein
LFVAFAIPCPTVFQQRIVQVIIATSAAGVGAMIPGFLSVTVPTLARAGGALGIFVLVLLTDPAGWAVPGLEAAAATASCVGREPVGFLVPRNRLPEELDPQNVEPLPEPVQSGAPVRFSLNYDFQPYPGRRQWTRVQPGVWVEVYPNPSVVTVHHEVGRGNIEGCAGTIVSPRDLAELKLFIPDRGCARMWMRFQQGESTTWAWLGQMDDVA